MPKITLTFTDTNPMPEALKAFKTSDTTAEVWVGTNQDAVAAELNPDLARTAIRFFLKKITLRINIKLWFKPLQATP
jgi:hypothetical protein